MTGELRLLTLRLALVLALGQPSRAVGQTAFLDVPQESRPPYDAVRVLAAKGVLRGSPYGLFNGKRAMTRGECFLACYRLLMWIDSRLADTPAPYPRPLQPISPSLGKPFADVPTDWDSEMGDALEFLGRAGLLNGYPDQTLGLERPMTHNEFEAVRERLQRWVDREMVRFGFAR
jgi:hypothetical protein